MASLSLALALVPFLILAFAASHSIASDADPLQDFCVTDVEQIGKITINGFVCKNPDQVTAYDFMSGLLSKPGNTDNTLGSAVTLAFAQNFPGLNTQGLSIARIDFAPNGLNPPHVHPRATEVLFLVQGTLEVGFVTATPNNNTLFQQTLYAGDLFVFPRGLVHFQLNADANQPAVSISGLNSQNPGVSILADALFAAKLPLPEEVLEKAFGIGKAEVDSLIESVATTLN